MRDANTGVMPPLPEEPTCRIVLAVHNLGAPEDQDGLPSACICRWVRVASDGAGLSSGGGGVVTCMGAMAGCLAVQRVGVALPATGEAPAQLESLRRTSSSALKQARTGKLHVKCCVPPSLCSSWLSRMKQTTHCADTRARKLRQGV